MGFDQHIPHHAGIVAAAVTCTLAQALSNVAQHLSELLGIPMAQHDHLSTAVFGTGLNV
ncbi:hypothetical protein D3C85_1887130 [compost metagenome]